MGADYINNKYKGLTIRKIQRTDNTERPAAKDLLAWLVAKTLQSIEVAMAANSITGILSSEKVETDQRVT